MLASTESQHPRFAPLPPGITHYELFYAQPRLGPEEVVIWERKREQINVPNDEEATRLMCEFLGSDILELKGATHTRTAISLVATRPIWRIVRQWGEPRVLSRVQ